MLRIGITGGIGSGKSTVCKLLELQGIPVFYADAEAKNAMVSDNLLIAQLKTAFGDDIYNPDLSLNRSKLAEVVFNDDAKLQQLNSIVHPAVFRLFDLWVEKQSSVYVVKEAALLFESHSYKDCDFKILVKSSEELKIKRVMQRDFITRENVYKRMKKQLSDDEKEKLSDFIINNNEQELLIPQVMNLHLEILRRASQFL